MKRRFAFSASSAAMTPREARSYYDRFGRKQDTQGFYEDPALGELTGNACFAEARAVFEFGCGTGKFAARLFADHLGPRATYRGCDISPVMVDLAAKRLSAFGERARIWQSDGTVTFPLVDRAVDRVVSTYVLDILPEEAIAAFFAEAHRILVPGGRLCLASLTEGTTLPSRMVAAVWKAFFRRRASLVGGCRPIRLVPFVDCARWKIAYHKIVTPFGVPSEVLVLSRI